VKKHLLHLAKSGVVLASVLAITGCGAPAARDFGGRWKPINQFQKDTTEIPLARPYAFFPAPMDGTLKAMLTRWAKDTGMLLSYQMPSDFTLTAAASRINTPNIHSAAAELNAVYAPQGVSVSVNQRQIVVQPMDASTNDAQDPSNSSKGAADPSAT
jgi:type IV pilus biogenesis protein CpaD/CtpE